MMQRKDFVERMNDSKNTYRAKGIECQTLPSETCPFKKCDGKGILEYINWEKKVDSIDNPQAYLQKEHEIQWQEPCDCYEQLEINRSIAEKIQTAGIPMKFSKSKVHSFKTDCYTKPTSRDAAEIAKKMAIQFVERYEELEDIGKGLYFCSKTKGSGKTRLVSSIANAIISKYLRSLMFIKAADLSAQVRKTYNKNSNVSEDEVLKIFRTVDVLVVDDLAVDDKTGYSEDLLGKILDYRMDNKLLTLITSNMTIDEIDTFYTKGIVGSRIRKLCYEVLMPEESVRDQEAAQENSQVEQILFGVGGEVK